MALVFGANSTDIKAEEITGTLKINGWKLTRMWWFHICKDSRKLLWPLSKAYYADEINITVRLQLRGPAVATWLSPTAYTYRKLRE